MLRRPLALLAAPFLLSLAPAALATEFTVDQAAPAGGDGTSAKPFQKIGDAAAVLQAGDTIWIKDGTYHETLNFYHLPGTYDSSHRTTISAAPGAAPIIDGDGTSNEYIVQAATPYMTFRGLTLRNGSAEAFQFYGCAPASCGSGDVPADYGEVIDCKTQNVSSGVVFYFASHGLVQDSDIYGGIAGKGTDGTLLVRNAVHDSKVEGVALHDDSKNCKYLNNVIYDNPRPNIYLDSCSNMTVDGNLIYMSSDPPVDNAGIQLADEKYAELTGPVTANITITNNVIFNTYDGIYFWDSGVWNGQSGMKSVTIANNTIVNSKNRAFFWDTGAHSNNFIRNNIVAQGAGTGQLFLRAHSTGGFSIDHNLWFMNGVAQPFDWGGTSFDHAGWVAASGQGAGDVLADPAFVGSYALPASSFALSAGSPAVDQGTADVPIPTNDHTLDHDFALASRPAGGGFDLGAFELGGTASDGGNPTLDAGPPPGQDGGVPPGNPDGSAGSGNGDAGNTPKAQSDSGSGCGCRTGDDAAPSSHALGLALLALAAGWSRRTRGPKAST